MDARPDLAGAVDANGVDAAGPRDRPAAYARTEPLDAGCRSRGRDALRRARHVSGRRARPDSAHRYEVPCVQPRCQPAYAVTAVAATTYGAHPCGRRGRAGARG